MIGKTAKDWWGLESGKGTIRNKDVMDLHELRLESKCRAEQLHPKRHRESDTTSHHVRRPLYPKGPCTNIVYTWALKGFPYSSFMAQVYAIWVHGPLGLAFMAVLLLAAVPAEDGMSPCHLSKPSHPLTPLCHFISLGGGGGGS